MFCTTGGPSALWRFAGAAEVSGLGPGDPVVIRWEDSANLILVA